VSVELKDFSGKSPAEAKDIIRRNAVLLALSPDKTLRDAAKVLDEHGIDGALAVVISGLSIKEHGVGFCVRSAIDIYKKQIKRVEKGTKKDFQGIKSALHEMECWVAWSSRCLPRFGNRSLPVVPLWRSSSKWCGLANLLLHDAYVELVGGSNTDKLSAMGIAGFLDKRVRQCKKGHKSS
jgi:hypothetical protein